jgi:hypothetical protein
MLVPDDVVHSYRAEGYAFLRGLISPEWLEVIRDGVEHNLAHPSPWAEQLQKHGGRFLTDNSNFSVNGEFQRLLYDSPIVDTLGKLIGADRLWLYYDQVFYKDGEAARTLWHQDMSYYLMEPGQQVIGAWISLDALPKELSLEVVARSHLGPVHNPLRPKNPLTAYCDIGGPPLPDIEAHRDEYEIVSFATEPGDMLIFHPNMFHGGAPMVAGQRRRTMTINVFGPEMRFQPRPEGHGPRFPGIENVLEPGEPLWHAAAQGYFHQLRPLPETRLGVLAKHTMQHGCAA